jgi:hypothetical protein
MRRRGKEHAPSGEPARNTPGAQAMWAFMVRIDITIIVLMSGEPEL